MTDCINDSKKMMEALREPFNMDEIQWRVQTASNGQNGYRLLVLPYIDNRTIMQRLDDVCGGFWQSHYDNFVSSGVEAFQCRLSLKIGGEWITRTDAAQGSDIESVKGGHSNAMKRAAVQWGIGRYLYDLKPFWVDLRERGEHRVYGAFTINKKKEHLEGYFETPKLPSWALPKPKSSRNVGPTAQQHQEPTPSNQQSSQSNDQEQVAVKDKQVKALAMVNRLLHDLNVPEKYIAPLLERSSGATIHYSEATPEDLGHLYRTLLPVYNYVKACRGIGLDEERMLFYAQIVLKEPLENIFSLFLKMTKDTCEQSLELMNDDLRDIENKKVV